MSNINELIYHIFYEGIDTTGTKPIIDSSGDSRTVIAKRGLKNLSDTDKSKVFTKDQLSSPSINDQVRSDFGSVDNGFLDNFGKDTATINQQQRTTSSVGTFPTGEPVSSEKTEWNPLKASIDQNAPLPDRTKQFFIGNKSIVQQPADSTATNPVDQQSVPTNQQPSADDMVALRQRNELQQQINNAALKTNQLGSEGGYLVKRGLAGLGGIAGGVGAGALGLLGLLLRNKALANAGLAGLAGGMYYGFNTPSALRQRNIDIANHGMKSNELYQQAVNTYGRDVADQMMTAGNTAAKAVNFDPAWNAAKAVGRGAYNAASVVGRGIKNLYNMQPTNVVY